jgi:hypothetical protein
MLIDKPNYMRRTMIESNSGGGLISVFAASSSTRSWRVVCGVRRPVLKRMGRAGIKTADERVNLSGEDEAIGRKRGVA